MYDNDDCPAPVMCQCCAHARGVVGVATHLLELAVVQRYPEDAVAMAREAIAVLNGEDTHDV